MSNTNQQAANHSVLTTNTISSATNQIYYQQPYFAHQSTYYNPGNYSAQVLVTNQPYPQAREQPFDRSPATIQRRLWEVTTKVSEFLFDFGRHVEYGELIRGALLLLQQLGTSDVEQKRLALRAARDIISQVLEETDPRAESRKEAKE